MLWTLPDPARSSHLSRGGAGLSHSLSQHLTFHLKRGGGDPLGEHTITSACSAASPGPSLDGVILFRRCLGVLRSIISSDYQSQVFKRYPLCILHTLSSCGRAMATTKACWWAELALRMPTETRCGSGSRLACQVDLQMATGPGHSGC